MCNKTMKTNINVFLNRNDYFNVELDYCLWFFFEIFRLNLTETRIWNTGELCIYEIKDHCPIPYYWFHVRLALRLAPLRNFDFLEFGHRFQCLDGHHSHLHPLLHNLHRSNPHHRHLHLPLCTHLHHLLLLKIIKSFKFV